MTDNSERPRAYLKPYPVRSRIARPQPLGLPVINMSFNELPFPPSAAVAKTIATACDNANRYGHPFCTSLEEKITQQFAVDADAIICGNGSEELLDVIARNFVQAGDEIVISQFGYIQFELTANRLNATLKKAPETNFTANTDALLNTITPATRLVFLANPNNPTGTLLPEAEVERLAANMPAQTVLVLDLAYAEFVSFEYCAKMHQLVDQYDNVIVTRTFSKAFGLAGLRVGWCHAPSWMIPGFYAARGMGTVNAVAQAAALAALHDIDEVYKRVVQIIAERERVVSSLSQHGIFALPSQANFLLLRFEGKDATSDTTMAEAFVEHLFDSRGILLNLTRESGLEGFFRVSLSLPEHNDMLVDCASEFINQYKHKE